MHEVRENANKMAEFCPYYIIKVSIQPVEQNITILSNRLDRKRR